VEVGQSSDAVANGVAVYVQMLGSLGDVSSRVEVSTQRGQEVGRDPSRGDESPR
jgi:hypothetical protein